MCIRDRPIPEIEKPIQTGDEPEEQAGERPIQMEDQTNKPTQKRDETEKPEPEKPTGSIDMNAIMMMFQRMEETMNKNTESLRKDRQEDREDCLLYTSRCV